MSNTPRISEPARDIPLVAEPDVAVVGGGTAGVMAALGAARAGAKTCLIERCAVVGGALSMGLVGHFYNRFRDGRGRDVVGGAPHELLDRLVASGATPYADVEDALSHGRVFFRHEYAAQVSLDMLREAGVEIWLQARFARALPAPDGRCDLLIETKSGRQAIRARQVVDATGEADVAAALGANIIHDPNRSWGLLCQMEGVDLSQYQAFLDGCPADCPDFTPWLARHLGLSTEEIKQDNYWSAWLDGGGKAWPFRTQIMAAVDAGHLALIQDLAHGGQIRYGWDGFWPESWYGPDKVFVNVCLITGLDPRDACHVSEAEIAARSYAFAFLGFLRKYVPGFQGAVISLVGAQTMPRGGAVIEGESVIADDDFTDGVIHPDAVCLGVPRPENPDSRIHGMPLGMFVPKGQENILVAGKCAAGGYAVRGTVYCMAAGYSCGIISALAASRSLTPTHLPRAELEAALIGHGVILALAAPRPAAQKPTLHTLPGHPGHDTADVAQRKKRLS